MMCSQVVVLLFLCRFYVNCVSSENPEIDKLERELSETKAAIEGVQQANTNLEQQISDIELDFKKNVTELEAQNANVSVAVKKENAKMKELYIVLTKLREKKSLIEIDISGLQHWIEERKLSIMFINQDLKVYNRRIDNGSAEKCFDFQKPKRTLLQGSKDDDQDKILMLQNELNQTRTKLNYESSVKIKLKMSLVHLTQDYKLKISNLLELLERNMGDEEHAKETVKKFETEVMEVNDQISELEVKMDDLIMEYSNILDEMDDLKGALLKITREMACFKKLEQLVLNTTVPSIDIPVTTNNEQLSLQAKLLNINRLIRSLSKQF